MKEEELKSPSQNLENCISHVTPTLEISERVSQQIPQEEDLLTRRDLALAIGRPHNLKKIRQQLKRIMSKDPTVQPQTIDVQKKHRKYRTTFFRRDALEQLLNVNLISLPDGQTIKANGGPEWQDVLQTLIGSRDKNEQIPKAQLVDNIPELKDLPPEKAAKKLNEILDFLNKKLKKLSSSGWQIRNIDAKGLALITQQERDANYYTVHDVKSATNKSIRTAERYLKEMLGTRINSVLLTEDTFNEAVLYIQSKGRAESQKLTEPSTVQGNEIIYPPEDHEAKETAAKIIWESPQSRRERLKEERLEALRQEVKLDIALSVVSLIRANAVKELNRFTKDMSRGRLPGGVSFDSVIGIDPKDDKETKERKKKEFVVTAVNETLDRLSGKQPKQVTVPKERQILAMSMELEQTGKNIQDVKIALSKALDVDLPERPKSSMVA